MGIILLFVGALFVSNIFVANNKEFFDTVDRQIKEGYTWHYTGVKPLDEPSVPSLPLQVVDPETGEGTGEPYVLWKLKKD